MIMSSYILSVIYTVLTPQEIFIFIEAILNGAIYYWKGDALNTIHFISYKKQKIFSKKKQKKI